jgi:hypothetical protein
VISVKTIAMLAACLLCSAVALGQETYCDEMETDVWTMYHQNGSYDGTWVATYETPTTPTPHSPVRCIRTSLHGGGGVGLDSDRAIAERTFTLGGDYMVPAVSVWYASMGISGLPVLDAGCYMQVLVYNADMELLDSHPYMISCFDDNEYWSNWEHLDGWYYQECRPAEYEPGAPDYCRLADGSIQPPVDWWYRLQVNPCADLLGLNWYEVEYLTIRLVAFGCFLSGNDVGVRWDDFCYTRHVLPSPVEHSSWACIKAMYQ